MNAESRIIPANGVNQSDHSETGTDAHMAGSDVPDTIRSHR